MALNHAYSPDYFPLPLCYIKVQWKMACAWSLLCMLGFISLMKAFLGLLMPVLFGSKVVGMEFCPAPFKPWSAGMACALFVMYLLSFWDSPCCCCWLILLSGHAPLIEPRCHSLIFWETPIVLWFPFQCFFIMSSLVLSVENYYIRCWWPSSNPDPHWWLASCQWQQCGPTLQTARYSHPMYYGIHPICSFADDNY